MYALIHNGAIQVGPRTWAYSFFKEYLDEEGLDSTALPRKDPGGLIVTDSWKILPVTNINQPAYNSDFEQLEGPFWTITDTNVTGSYNAVPQTMSMAQGKLKEKVTNTRYRIENGGAEYTLLDGTTVTIYTAREDRSVYLDAYQVIPDGTDILFKFKGNVFKLVAKEELSSIIAAGAAHIQNSFVWEAGKYAEIDNATTIDELKLIDIRHPSEVEEE